MAGIAGERWVLLAHPEGMPDGRHLRLEAMTVPDPGEGEVRLRTIWLSLDPYMRGRMSPGRSYAAALRPGDTMTGQTVSAVIDSRHPDWHRGDVVLAGTGWASHGVVPGGTLERVATLGLPLSTALGIMGMPGFTAYAGLLVHGRPLPGETVVVAAASGAVGQIVGQIARLKGARPVAIAGAPDKCRMAVEDFGYETAVCHRDARFRDDLRAACPQGIDVYFENVGGLVLDAVMPLMNDFGRIPVCGLISAYNAAAEVHGPDPLARFMRLVLTRRLAVRGFIQFDHNDLRGDFRRDMAGWLAAGRLRYREDRVMGLGQALAAFQGLLEGKNRGKLVVGVGTEP